MFKDGDKVLVKATVEKVTDDYVRIYAEGYGERSFSLECAPIEQKTYTQGLADAWGLAKKIVCTKGGMPYNEIEAIFGSGCAVEDILLHITAEEALAKIEAYEREGVIKLGDEVVHSCDGYKTKFYVTYLNASQIKGIDKDGNTHYYTLPNRHTKKTGKHIDIESFLKQIGE